MTESPRRSRMAFGALAAQPSPAKTIEVARSNILFSRSHNGDNPIERRVWLNLEHGLQSSLGFGEVAQVRVRTGHHPVGESNVGSNARGFLGRGDRLLVPFGGEVSQANARVNRPALRVFRTQPEREL